MGAFGNLRARIASVIGGKSLTAAFSPADMRGGSMLPFTSPIGWQYEVTRLYDLVPELRYALFWTASSASRATLFTAKQTGQRAPEPVGDNDPAGIPLREFAPTQAEQSAKIMRITTLLKLVGEWRQVGYDRPDGSRQWIIVSPQDINGTGTRLTVHDPDLDGEILLEKSRTWAIRMYWPHPVHASKPDSPVHALIPTLHELIDLSAHVQTAAKSRLAGAGLLLIPNSLSTATPGQTGSLNPPDGDPVLKALQKTSRAAIRHPHDMSRHLPVVLRGNQEALNAVRRLDLWSEFDSHVDDLRQSAVRRIATGLDIPGEILLGLGGLNHWTAWLVDASAQRINVAPTLAFICREMTVKYLHPALRRMGIADADQYMIWYDDASATSAPNKSDMALAAYEMGLIGGDAARATLGYNAADKPSPGEIPPATDFSGRLLRDADAFGPASGEESQVGMVAAVEGISRRVFEQIGNTVATKRDLRRGVNAADAYLSYPVAVAQANRICDEVLNHAGIGHAGMRGAVRAYVSDRIRTKNPHSLGHVESFLSSYRSGT